MMIFLGVSFSFSQLRLVKVGFFLAVPYILVIACLRGDVGVDTYSYLINISKIINNELTGFVFEPGFTLMIMFLGWIGFEPRLILLFIAFLTSFILFYAFFKIENSKPFFLIFLVIPLFYFDMTMNGVRYGLSFSLVALAASNLNLTGSNRRFFFLIILSASIQFTGLLLGLLLYFIVKRKIKIAVYTSIIFFAVLLLIEFLSGSFFSDKITAYSSIQSPTYGSGLTIALVGILTILTFLYFENKCKINFFICKYLTILTIATLCISQISYAGLRLQSLVLFLTFLLFSMYSREMNRNNGIYYLVIISVGFLGFIFKLNNFVDGENIGFTPFIPYMFIWDVYE